MIRYTGHLDVYPDAFPRGPLPIPSRSFVLGDPNQAQLHFGCIVTIDYPTIDAGYSGSAVFDVVESERAWVLPINLPLWYGRVIGQVSKLKRVDA